MTSKINIFATGVTGYIGGSVLARLLEHPDAGSFHVTALVRSEEKANKLKALGVNAVVGTHSELGLIKDLASEADVVIAMADADNIKVVHAILQGIKERHTKIGAPSILIHTVHVGVLADNAEGKHKTDIIYDDADPAQLELLPPTQLHRNVDLELLEADKEGYVKVYIIAPSTIYGIASNKLVDEGIQNPHSIQIPALIAASLDRGQGGMVGEGKNLWPNVEIAELADLYIKLLDAINSESFPGHGREGFYFGENGEHSLYEVGKAIAEALVELGKGKSTEPTPFTKEEIDKYFGGSAYLGSNSRCRGNRSRSIGWKPVKTTKDMLASIKPEVEALIKRNYKPQEGKL
ncbi:NAD(P)-binding protein [Crucibulum laeve]|uniref:NAD(P)-binding protein n=1 Tax=Crucibulum laeve TaxID=68775 RepID=A0A5C3M4R3_9AGAR|nr:NAD(P)-binding protein [Crucibulum laeve]